AALTRESHTLKRALTDPRLFSGVGNAYSDEILHAAKLSPLKLTTQLTAEEIERLHHATQDTLRTWIERLRKATGDGFPEGVTAFREEMAVHGRYRKPCPVCGSPVQRIRYAENEVNYCATCQTGGRVLADRALSRLLQEDWPRSLEEWEARLPAAFPAPSQQLTEQGPAEQQRRGRDVAIPRHDERRLRAARRRDQAAQHLFGDQHHVPQHHDGGEDVGTELLEALVQRPAGG